MNDDLIVTTYVVIDEVMRALGHRSHCLAHISDAEVLTVAVVGAKYFHSNHERALPVMQLGRYPSGRLSTSRFNRRLRALAAWCRLILETLGELFAQGEAFLLDSMPVPACHRAGQAVSQTIRPGVLQLLCGQAREVLRLVPAPDLHRRRRSLRRSG